MDEEDFIHFIEYMTENTRRSEDILTKRRLAAWPKNLLSEIFGAESIELKKGAEGNWRNNWRRSSTL